MSLLQVVILAVLQGITEFLPVSSSAHLALAPWLLGWTDQGLTFDIALHVGTLMAVLIYFFRDWMQIIAQGFGAAYGPDEELRRNRWMLWLLALGTVPVGLLGAMFHDQAENNWRHNHLLIGGMLVFVGLLMLAAEKLGRRNKSMDVVSLKDTLATGLAQSLAIVPGTSRSGITMTAGLLCGMDRATAARFSFLLATPAIGGAAVKAAYDLYLRGGIPSGMQLHFLLGVALSAMSGCAVIYWLLRYVKRRSFLPFVIYRIVFGIIVIALALSRRPAG